MDEKANHLFGQLNVNEIEPGIILGSAICCRDHFDQLLRDKVDDLSNLAVLSLEGERPVFLPEVVEHKYIAVRDGEGLERFQFEEAAEYITEKRKEGKTVYVHCTNGFGRAPSALAGYYVSQGMDVESAVAKIKKERSLIFLNAEQFAALYDYKKSILTHF